MKKLSKNPMMNQFPNLITKRLDLVEIQSSHAKDLYLLFSDKDMIRIMQQTLAKPQKVYLENTNIINSLSFQNTALAIWFFVLKARKTTMII